MSGITYNTVPQFLHILNVYGFGFKLKYFSYKYLFEWSLYSDKIKDIFNLYAYVCIMYIHIYINECL